MTRTDGALAASWPAVNSATHYHVTYTNDGGSSWSLAALKHAGSSIDIAGVDNAKSYIVGVRAGNADGWSGWVNSPAAGPYTPPQPTPTPTPEPTPTPTPTPNPAPGPVSSVAVTRADGSLTASWPAVNGATKYHVTYTDNGGQSWSLAALNHAGSSIDVRACRQIEW